MAKKQITPDETSESSTLSERARAERVLVSQGRAIGLLGSLGPDRQKRLAEFATDDGTVLPAAVAGVCEVFNDFYTEQKATVDEDLAQDPTTGA